ncbi:hypothetical protein OBBRIDRAFT_883930 [Obba rivulosa]|uniref:Methyltransferase domain-containing protein n=1 Tax=Obba rivulosa TaxID=1052685 RepID=A0A8E2DTF5_9APHY|nr:hypothetical protein OBBRIDRAFT_883930 [Obba rivulosa]
MTLTHDGISKDVQEELLEKTATQRKRSISTVPYPVNYSKDLLVFESWNNMFLNSLCRGLTIHKFQSPPIKILDLGCGAGFWVIEAAKAWPYSTFVGFDILRVQPDLSKSEVAAASGDISPRVTWIRGNFLERLPFPDGQFDFVRICCIGLGVPENEWPHLLEEVARVMQPGAVLEVIEEDLIFPCAQIPTTDDHSFLSPVDAKLESDLSSSVSKSSLSSVYSSSSSSNRLTTSGLLPFPVPSTSVDSPQRSVREDFADLLDPRDHSRLCNAWDEMLHRRFLAEKLLSVLPFYLSSSFDDIQTHPTLRVLLPQNSPLDFDGGGKLRHLDLDMSTLFLELQGHSLRLSESRADESSLRSVGATTSALASLHLARAVRTIRGCKEKIWEVYRVAALVKPESDSRSDLLEQFKAEWANWESDMKDRMAVHSILQESFAWDAPIENERPDWKAWRERVGDLGTSETDSTTGSNDLCRSLRAFVARKP